MERVFLVHNFYRERFPSGENAVIRMEREMLVARGHHVESFEKFSDSLESASLTKYISGIAGIPWNFGVAREFRLNLEKFSPDVVHVHNTFPMVSPSIFWASRGLAARVLTLHNYRLFCPNAIPMREGRVCTDCMDRRSVIPAMNHGCYRNSRIATAPLAASVSLHRTIGTWKKQVDAFICLSEFQKELMIGAGLPRHKVHVKPNFYSGQPEEIPWAKRRPSIVFAGRLGAEKGVLSLLKAWQEWGVEAPELRIVGDGPLLNQLKEMAEGLPVLFLGQLSADAAQREISQCMLQILPSEWFEGFPMVIREAFAFGTPAAVSRIGPLPSIVTHGKNGVVFEASDPVSLLNAVKRAWETPGFLRELGSGARREFEERYNEQANYEQLMDIYREAKNVAKHEISKR